MDLFILPRKVFSHYDEAHLHLDLKAQPKIQMNYLSTARDQTVAAESIQITRDIVSCMNPKYNPLERKPGLEYKTKEELVKAAGGLLSFIFFHLF